MVWPRDDSGTLLNMVGSLAEIFQGVTDPVESLGFEGVKDQLVASGLEAMGDGTGQPPHLTE